MLRKTFRNELLNRVIELVYMKTSDSVPKCYRGGLRFSRITWSNGNVRSSKVAVVTAAGNGSD